MVNTQTRWPLPRAQAAQPERWRMRRRSKEPRRISVVEGSAAASLARFLITVSCFIYKNETTKPSSSQPLPEHFVHLCCWASAQEAASTESVLHQVTVPILCSDPATRADCPSAHKPTAQANFATVFANMKPGFCKPTAKQGPPPTHLKRWLKHSATETYG